MKGAGRAAGAVSIVNALACGIGCAAGIDIPVRAEVELGSVETDDDAWQIPPAVDTPLVRASLRRAVSVLAPGQRWAGRLEVYSEVPPGRGLKSSSAVSSAIVSAVARALGKSPRPEAIARISADAGLSAGVSATGAFDDAMAAITGDVVVADNPSRTVLRREPADASWRALLWIPREPHAPAPELLARFAELEPEGQEVASIALEGDFVRAMSENSALVERVMGYPYAALRSQLQQEGAVTSGVSGLGPAVCAIVHDTTADRVAAVFPQAEGEVRRVRFGLPGDAGAGS